VPAQLPGAALAARTPALAALALAALLAAAPLAAAKPAPALYFLHDAPLAAGTPPSPLGDGIMNATPPPPLNLTDPTQDTPPSTRTILPAEQAVLPVQFVANASANTGRIYGVVIAYLFLPKSPALQSGVLNVSLVELPADPSTPPPVGGGGTPIAWARLDLSDHTASGDLPDNFTDPAAAAQFVADHAQSQANGTANNVTYFAPSNVTDPAGTAAELEGKLLVTGITTVYSSGHLLYLDDAKRDYVVDHQVDPKARLALRMVLENGTSPGGLPGLPAAVGAGQDVIYDFLLAPSLVSVPWYAPDPPKPPAPPPTSHTATTGPGPSQGGHGTSTTTTTKTKGSPGVPEVAVLAGLVGVAVAMRRRLR